SKTRVSNGLIFVSGQVPITPNGEILKGTLTDQTKQIMENIKEALSAEGASLSDIVKTTIYVTDMVSSKEVSDEYISYFSEPYPAREMVCVKELPLGAEIEISVIAGKVE
ncbi:MAG: reactive intermediate/imine deaminase, partial [Candidatus Harrisonbacteria bacterium CG10_big_fil_rev_8_21_14_0_10_38_8]